MTKTEIATQIINTAAAYGVDPRLALEVAMKESNLSQSAVSSAGAIGIFQLMPATAASLGVDPRDATQNIKGGCMLLGELLSRFAGDYQKALASYNWHPDAVSAAVMKYGSDWLAHVPSETIDYVTTILGNLESAYSVSIGPAPSNAASSIPPLDQAGIPSGLSLTEMLVMGALAFLGLLFVGSFE